MSTGSLVFLVALLTISHGWLEWNRLLAYLRYFQQEAYEPIRFVRWAGLRSFGDPAAVVAVAGFLV